MCKHIIITVLFITTLATVAFLSTGFAVIVRLLKHYLITISEPSNGILLVASAIAVIWVLKGNKKRRKR